MTFYDYINELMLVYLHEYPLSSRFLIGLFVFFVFLFLINFIKKTIFKKYCKNSDPLDVILISIMLTIFLIPFGTFYLNNFYEEKVDDTLDLRGIASNKYLIKNVDNDKLLYMSDKNSDEILVFLAKEGDKIEDGKYDIIKVVINLPSGGVLVEPKRLACKEGTYKDFLNRHKCFKLYDSINTDNKEEG